MCGIIAIIAQTPNEGIFQRFHSGAVALQHRGYDGFGFAYTCGNVTTLQTRQGTVAIDNVPIEPVSVAIGHTRYRTSGHLEATQPIWHKDIYFVHNGQVTSESVSRSQQSDSELMGRFIAKHDNLLNNFNDIVTLCQKIAEAFHGSYSCVLYTKGQLIAFRDPHGIRPLVIGKNSERTEWSFASETVALEAMNHVFHSEVGPGEVVVVRRCPQRTICVERARYITASTLRPCLFEYIYLAHKHSVLNGIKVLEARQAFGRTLAKDVELQQYVGRRDDVVVVPVPKTSCPAARALAQELDVPYWKLMHRKKSSGRSFILCSDQKRQETVGRKFTYVDASIYDTENKILLLVDDSIVRGTTMKHVVKTIRQRYKPKKICVISIAPPLLYPNIYGIDIPTKVELIAVTSSNDIAKALGADQVVYQKLDCMLECLQNLNPSIKEYETSVFDGKYLPSR